MRSLPGIKDYSTGNWRKGGLLTGVIIGSIIFLSCKDNTTQILQSEYFFTSPDSLTAYMLSSQDQRMLAEWQDLQRTGNLESVRNWVGERYLPLQNIGLKLLEHATLNFAQGNNELATDQINICTALGKTLAEVVKDSFLKDQTDFFKNLENKQLQTRAAASALYAKAYNELRLWNIAESQEFYKQVIELADRIGDAKLQIEAMLGLQYTHYYRNEHRLVIELGEEIIEKAEHVGYHRRLALALPQVTEAYRNLGLYDKALQTIEKTIEIAEIMNDHEVLARNYFSQAQLYYQMEQYENAELTLQKAIKVDREAKYTGLVKLTQGLIYVKRGEYGRAQIAYENAVEIFRSKKEKLNQAAALSDLALLYDLMGEYENALDRERQSLEIKKQEENEERAAWSLGNIGLYYIQMDSLEKAMNSYQKALQLLQSGGKRPPVSIWLRIGDIHLKNGDLQHAAESFATAESLAQSINYNYGKVDALIGYGKVALKRGQTARARNYFNKALEIAEMFSYPELVTSAHFGLSIVEMKSNNFDKASDAIEMAIQSSERIRQEIYRDTLQVSFFARTQDLFDQAILVSLARGRRDLAFHYSERARARALLDALGKITIEEMGERDRTLLASKVPNPNELIKSIPASVQVVEYRITPDTLLVWLLYRNKLVLRRLPISSLVLEAKVRHFLNSIGAENLQAFQMQVRQNIEAVYNDNRQMGRELYKLLVAPIADKLKADKKLYIIPDGYLHRLPFGSLVTDDERFFDERYVWAKAPSLTILYQALTWHKKIVEPQNSRFLMVAGDLPSTKLQKKWMTRLFNNSVILEKNEANYQALKDRLSAGVEIVYFSVHAVADERHPMSSYIELYSDPASNG
ncbi:MAG: tetratricopeptide repeat protein, partial [bacterium]